MEKARAIKDWQRMYDDLTGHLKDKDLEEKLKRRKASLKRKEEHMLDTGL